MKDLIVPKGLSHISLPTEGSGHYRISPFPECEDNVRVYDGARQLAVIPPGAYAIFRMEDAAWWRFWRAPRWTMVMRSGR